MPIHVPGKRDRNGKIGAGKRSVVAVLSLTAMVDLFTVLVVFLLQNYATTGEVLEIPEGVELPKAEAVKELGPANVVVISKKGVYVNNTEVGTLDSVQAQQDWLVTKLYQEVQNVIAAGEKEKATIGNQLKIAVKNVKDGDKAEQEIDKFRKMTIQADKEVDFLTIKKIMYTVTEGGIYEINFAVLKEESTEGT